MKKGQVTLFIIIVVVVLVSIGLYFYLNENFLDESVSSEVRPIYTFIESCLEEASEDAVVTIGKNGGYAQPSSVSTDKEHAIYLLEEKNIMPSQEEVEEQLSLYVKNNIEGCVKEVKNFEGFDIEHDALSMRASLEKNDVIFSGDYPFRIIKGEQSYDFRNFEIKIPVRLGVIYSSIEDYMEKQIEAPREVCVSCVYKLGIEQDLYFHLEDYDNQTVLFTITDEQSKIDGKEYVYIFANRYEVKQNEVV